MHRTEVVDNPLKDKWKTLILGLQQKRNSRIEARLLKTTKSTGSNLESCRGPEVMKRACLIIEHIGDDLLNMKRKKGESTKP